jgi:uncharacterized protein
MNSSKIQLSILFLTTLLVFGAVSNPREKTVASTEHGDNAKAEEQALIIQYLEIVTTSVDETCEALAEAHGITFGESVAEFGNAKTANLRDGGRIGVRAPMRTTESPVVRPYILVADIEAAVKAAENAGAQIAIPPMEIPGQGTFSIYILGGIEHGLWQL